MTAKPKTLFITFEGLDASGKSTQIKLLSSYFNKLNIEHIISRDPGGTQFGQKIRQILLDKESEISPVSELLLYASDRCQHVVSLIKPKLESGVTVICDRFIDSTVAYQGFGRQIPLNIINQINNIATDNLKPDITFLLDLDTSISMNRRDSKFFDRLESESQEFHDRVRKGYLKSARLFPQRFCVINANKPIGTIQFIIKKVLKDKYDIG